jgi:hypothetical protein
MKKAVLLIMVISLVATGCGYWNITTPDDVLLKSKVWVDSYKKVTWVKSPIFKGTVENRYYAYLRTVIKDNDVKFYQFYVTDYNYRSKYVKGWKYYRSAHDSDGNRLDLNVLERKKVDEERASEDFTITLSREYLSKAKSNGLDIRAYGDKGNRVFILPAFYIEGFLMKVDNVLQTE